MTEQCSQTRTNAATGSTGMNSAVHGFHGGEGGVITVDARPVYAAGKGSESAMRRGSALKRLPSR